MNIIISLNGFAIYGICGEKERDGGQKGFRP